MASPKIEIYIPADKIQTRIAELGAQISRDYGGRPLVLIGILKGSFMFMADLVRHLESSVRIEFMGTRSYEKGTSSSGQVQLTKDLDKPIDGEDVLLVEDIVDTGFTARYLLQTLAGRGPNSLSLCTLLDRTSRRIVQIPVDFRCFEIPDRFVVGCGLDYQQLYRNLSYIAVMKHERSQ